jgi:hypothetical protein
MGCSCDALAAATAAKTSRAWLVSGGWELPCQSHKFCGSA